MNGLTTRKTKEAILTDWGSETRAVHTSTKLAKLCTKLLLKSRCWRCSDVRLWTAFISAIGADNAPCTGTALLR